MPSLYMVQESSEEIIAKDKAEQILREIIHYSTMIDKLIDKVEGDSKESGKTLS